MEPVVLPSEAKTQKLRKIQVPLRVCPLAVRYIACPPPVLLGVTILNCRAREGSHFFMGVGDALGVDRRQRQHMKAGSERGSGAV